MKDSGIEWIGQIPDHWEIVRMKSCIQQRDSGAWGDESNGSDGDAICLRIADFDYSRFRFKDTPIEELTKRHYNQSTIDDLKLQKFDILIEKSGGGEKTPVGRTVVFDKEYLALYANFMDRLRCADFILPTFMQYVFVTFYKNEYTRNYIKQTTGIQNLDLTSMLSEEYVPLPPLSEQKAIADFLDKQCAEIDAVIEQTKATIEEYKALKQSVITEAVTKGIRGDRPMKDSGIEWIGEIPAEWSMQKMNRICSTITDYVASGSFASLAENVQYLDEPDYAMLIRTMDVSAKGYIGKPVYINKHAYDFLSNSNLFGGEIILPNIGASVGDIYIVPKLYERMSLAPNAIMIKTVISDKYVYYYYCGLPGRLSLLDIAQSTAQPKFNKTDFRQLKIPVPGHEEQEEIVLYLDQKCAEIDTLIEKKTALLEEMEALKKSTIFEYVTGKKKVLS